MSKDEILQKYGSESEEYRHYCELQYVIKLKKVDRDEYFRKIEERRGVDARNKLWGDAYAEWIIKKSKAD